MSTKRRKVGHGNGIKEASVQLVKPKSKTKPQPIPAPIEPAQPPISEAESETLDNASGEGNGEPAQKSFQDLVRQELDINMINVRLTRL